MTVANMTCYGGGKTVFNNEYWCVFALFFVNLRFLIGWMNISDFLKDSEIKGPVSFSCNTRSGCKFEESAMNDLINSIFGDSYITLQCKGREYLHYSQVPS
jgi:hypothetical protein